MGGWSHGRMVAMSMGGLVVDDRQHSLEKTREKCEIGGCPDYRKKSIESAACWNAGEECTSTDGDQPSFPFPLLPLLR